jgi:hypothetical protein
MLSLGISLRKRQNTSQHKESKNQTRHHPCDDANFHNRWNVIPERDENSFGSKNRSPYLTHCNRITPFFNLRPDYVGNPQGNKVIGWGNQQEAVSIHTDDDRNAASDEPCLVTRPPGKKDYCRQQKDNLYEVETKVLVKNELHRFGLTPSIPPQLYHKIVIIDK